MAERQEDLEPEVVAVLAHGLLNGLSIVRVGVEVLLRSTPDAEVVERITPILDAQLETMVDTLRLLALGSPDAVGPSLS